MSTYVTRADIEAELDSYHLAAALDDNKDGAEDAGLFTALAGSVDAQVSAHADMISQLGYPTPPATLLRYCARVFMCALLFRRRGTGDGENPYAQAEKDLRDKLGQIESGTLKTKPIALAIISTGPSTHVFDSSFDAGTETASATSATVTVIEGPDGKLWQMKIKYLSGQPVHYWEEVA